MHGNVLMTNHYHPLVETPEGNLSTGMQVLNGRYSQAFNAEPSRKGHLFEDRYEAIVVERARGPTQRVPHGAVFPVAGPS